jgi:hypothetical protein
MILGILIFSVLVFFVSFLISKRISLYDRSEIASYMAIIAWGSLIFGLFIAGLDGHSVNLLAAR